MADVYLRYVGKKPWTVDNIGGTGILWNGNGDIQPVPPEVAEKLLKHPDQWEVAEVKAKAPKKGEGPKEKAKKDEGSEAKAEEPKKDEDFDA